MKTSLVLATGLSLAVQNSSAVRLSFVNRDDDGSDEYDRLEESIHNDTNYMDILQFSENVKDGKISAESQVKEEKPVDVTVNVTVNPPV